MKIQELKDFIWSLDERYLECEVSIQIGKEKKEIRQIVNRTYYGDKLSTFVICDEEAYVFEFD